MGETAGQQQEESADRFIFVCYSHADTEVVTQQVDWLRTQGYDVWWDENIRGGAEWNDELARHIQESEWFLYFVSPTSVLSQHCRAELNYAQQHERRIIAIELEPTEVPAGLQLMLNARQIVFKHKHNKDEFQRRVIDSLQVKGDMATSPTAKLHHAAPHVPKRKRHWLIAAVLTALLLAVAAVVMLQTTKSTPIEFQEQDWVVVGNLQNKTGDPLIGETLDTSLRFALKQSKYASIVSDVTVREAKSRMQLDPDAPLNQEAAIELAQRENAKASVLGSITQLGNSYRISIEIFDAATGASVWAGESNAANIDELLPAIDDISRQVREQLGESLSAIAAASEPLAKVTTPDFEALRAYSLSEKAVARGDWETGLELLQRAVAKDPEFAMAHGKIAAINIAWALRPERAAKHYEIALQNKQRLTPREAIYVEASSAWQKTPAEMKGAWEAMTLMHPNESVGFNNLGEVLRRYYLDYEAAEAAYRSSAELRDPWVYIAVSNIGQALLAQNRPADALASFQMSYNMEGNPIMFSMADAYTVLGQHDEALAFIETSEEFQSPNLIRAAQSRHLGLYADLGEFEAALELTTKMLGEAESPDQFSRIHAARVALLERGNDFDAFRQALAEALEFEMGRLEQGTQPMARNTLAHLVILARVAVRSGAPGLAEPAIEVVRRGIPDNGFPVDQAWYELMEAEILLQRGAAAEALLRLNQSIDNAGLFQAYDSLARIHAALGNEAERIAALKLSQENRGLAFAESVDWFYGQLFNIVDWSRAQRELMSLEATAGLNASVQTVQHQAP